MVDNGAALVPSDRFWPGVLVVLAACSLLFGTDLGGRSQWSEEARWVQIPREMAREGSYFWPTFNGHPYYDKPAGSYWLVLLASRVTGSINVTAARLPSALGGLIAVLLTMLIARRLHGARVAVLAGAALGTSSSFVFFSRHASADVETVAGVLFAFWWFLRHESRGPGWWVLPLWLTMAGVSLLKGLLGFALPLLLIGAYLASRAPIGPWRPTAARALGWLWNRHSALALPLSVAAYFLPFAVSYALTGSNEGLAMVFRENIQRFFRPANHRGPIHLYAYQIFLLFAPWGLLLPAALWQAHHTWRADRAASPAAFPLAAFWAVMAFFTLAASRRSYYLLPILPFASILVARALVAPAASLARPAACLRAAGLACYALLLTLGAAAAALPAGPWPRPQPLVVAAGAATAAALALSLLFALARAQPLGPRVALASWLVMAFGYLFVLPAGEATRSRQPFADAVRLHTAGHLPLLALYRHREIASFLEPPRPLTELETPDQVQRAACCGQVRWVIAKRRELATFHFPYRLLAEEAPADGQAAARKLVLMDLAAPPPH